MDSAAGKIVHHAADAAEEAAAAKAHGGGKVVPLHKPIAEQMPQRIRPRLDRRREPTVGGS